MIKLDDEIRITPSVLDRLIDYEPELSREAPASRVKNLRQLKQGVKRDLEWLLNTRRVSLEVPTDLKEINNSLAVYGLPDFAALNVKSPSDQALIKQELETVLNIFEPCLEHVQISIEALQENERALHFRIDAQLKIEPVSEPVSFDTVLRLDNGRYLVKEE